MNNATSNETANTVRLQDLLEADHDRLDDLFSSFRQAKEENPEQAGRYLEQFARELRHHIEWEDEELFPRYEKQVDPLGLTRSMRADHREILRIIEKIQERWAKGHYQETDWNAGRLRSMLDRHNAKEEDRLNPERNKLLSADEKRTIAEAFRNRDTEEID